MGTILTLLVSGFIVGGLARWAVPGPDPMPIWLTVLIGLAGSWLGGAVASALFGSSAFFWILLFEIAAAALLVVAYRRFVQRRPITGPDAYRLPTRGIGIARMRRRLQDLGVDPDRVGEERVEEARRRRRS